MFEDTRDFQLSEAYIKSVFGTCVCMSVYGHACAHVIYTSTGSAKG